MMNLDRKISPRMAFGIILVAVVLALNVMGKIIDPSGTILTHHDAAPAPLTEEQRRTHAIYQWQADIENHDNAAAFGCAAGGLRPEFCRR